MATRLYLSNAQAAPVSPAFGSWGETSEAVRRAGLKAKEAGESLAAGTRIGWAAGQTQLDRQYVFPPMAAGLVFNTSVTYKLQLACREFNAGDNSTSRCAIYIYSQDGNTLRATIKSIAQYGPATEYINNATLRNKTFLDGDAGVGSYTTVAGDRLVLEIGHTDAAGSTPEAQARYGAPSGTADHGENETETTSLVPWFETSLNITWLANFVDGAVVLTGEAALAAVGALSLKGAAVLAGEAQLVATGTTGVIHLGAAVMTGEAVLAAAARMLLAGQAALIGEAQLVADGAVETPSAGGFTG